MRIKFKKDGVLAAGYKMIPKHPDSHNSNRQEEFVRILNPSGFPRFHLKCDKWGEWNMHYDKFAFHGHENPGSIIDKGVILEAEKARIRVYECYAAQDMHRKALANYEVELDRKVADYSNAINKVKEAKKYFPEI